MPECRGEILDDLVGIGIVGMRPDFQLAALHARREDAPMRGVRHETAFDFIVQRHRTRLHLLDLVRSKRELPSKSSD